MSGLHARLFHGLHEHGHVNHVIHLHHADDHELCRRNHDHVDACVDAHAHGCVDDYEHGYAWFRRCVYDHDCAHACVDGHDYVDARDRGCRSYLPPFWRGFTCALTVVARSRRSVKRHAGLLKNRKITQCFYVSAREMIFLTRNFVFSFDKVC